MNVPENLFYTEEHEWVLIEGNIATIGVTDFAQDALDEIVYVEVDTVGEDLDKNEVFGTIEAAKTTSELFLPLAGKIAEFNESLDENEGDNPVLVNEDPYGKGWIIKVELSDAEDREGLLSPDAYKELIG